MKKNLQIKYFHTKGFSCVPPVFPAEWFLAEGRGGEGVEATLSITEGTEKNAESIKRGKKSAPSSSHCSDDSFGWEDSRKTALSFTQKNSKSTSDKLFSDLFHFYVNSVYKVNHKSGLPFN